jgi:hypothetical protein
MSSWGVAGDQLVKLSSSLIGWQFLFEQEQLYFG